MIPITSWVVEILYLYGVIERGQENLLSHAKEQSEQFGRTVVDIAEETHDVGVNYFVVRAIFSRWDVLVVLCLVEFVSADLAWFF